MRGAYTVGVLTAIEEHYGLKKVDIVTGSSAGIGTLVFYIAGNLPTVYNIWAEELCSKKFLSARNVFRGKPFLDIDYLVDVLYKKTLDPKKVRESKTKLIIPLLNEKTGAVSYFDNYSGHDIFELMRASMAIPLAYGKTVKLNGEPYMDAGSVNPLPLDHPEIKNSRKIIILTKNENPPSWPIKRMYEEVMTLGKSKIVRNALKNKERVYKEQMDNLEGDVIIRPTHVMDGLDNNQLLLQDSILSGYKDALNNEDLRSFIEELRFSDKRDFYFDQ